MCKNTNKAYEDAIEYLKTSPMFNLSLSSKELFHSNFLYWIWKLDPNTFKSLIARLLNISPDDLKWGDKWEVVREYNSFDLCVIKYCDEDSNNDEDTGARKIDDGDVLLVIENKVKSIPYKAQLKKYVDKVNELYGKRRKEDADKVQYILLTLPTHFPDAPKEISSEDCNWEFGDYKWKIVTYNKYIEILKELKISSSDDLDEQTKVYPSKIIEDYIKFVEHLLVIYKEWTDECYTKLGFIYYDEQKQQCSEYKDYITVAQALRIHDLYHKSKYARICAEIISTFSDVNIDDYEVGINLTEKEVCKYLEKKGNENKGYIVWEYNYTHGEPLVGVKIARRDKDDNLITYIIQVQSGVYEHGVIADHTKLKGEYKGTKDEKLWAYIYKNSNKNVFSVGNYPWMRYEEWDNDATKDSHPLSSHPEDVHNSGIFDTSALYPQFKIRKDTLPYAKYASDNSNIAMIYQFRKLKFDVETTDLIEYIITDVKSLLKGLNNQQ